MANINQRVIPANYVEIPPYFSTRAAMNLAKKLRCCFVMCSGNRYLAPASGDRIRVPAELGAAEVATLVENLPCDAVANDGAVALIPRRFRSVPATTGMAVQ